MSDKQHKGMINFNEPILKQKIGEDPEVNLPDEVFEELSLIYFQEVYTKHAEELKKVRESIDNLTKMINELKSYIESNK